MKAEIITDIISVIILCLHSDILNKCRHRVESLVYNILKLAEQHFRSSNPNINGHAIMIIAEIIEKIRKKQTRWTISQ